MKYTICIAALLLCQFILGQNSAISTLEAEQDKNLKSKLDLHFYTGVSSPIGKFSLLTAESNDRSAAGLGGFAELYASITPLTSSPWRLGLTIGYMHQPFQVLKSVESYDLPFMQASSWNSYYFMLGIGYCNKQKMLFGINADFGIMGYTGGDILSGEIINNSVFVRSWKYGTKAVGALKLQIKWGLRLNQQVSIFATVATLYAAAIRKGDFYRSECPNTGGPIGRNLSTNNEKTIEIQNQTTIFVVNCGVGFRYQFFKKSESLHYRLNIEQNL